MGFYRAIAVGSAALFAINGAAAQVDSPPGSASASLGNTRIDVQSQSVIREIDLAELGFRDDLELEGLSGSRDLFFAVPAAANINSLTLRLPFQSDSAFESRRSIRLTSGGRTLFTRALPAGPLDDVIELPIDPSLVQNGFLNIRLEYAGAITDDRCVDQRISGAFLRLDRSGGLVADLKPEAVDRISKISALMPARAQIFLPASASEGQAAAALTLGLSQVDARITSAQSAPNEAGANWNSAQIAFGSAQASAIAVQWDGGQPQFIIGGSDPIGTARFFRSNWRTSLGAASAAQASAVDGQPPESVTLADLGSGTVIQDVSGRGQWNTAIPLAALPAGSRLEGAVIETIVAEDGGVTPPIVTVLLNGLLLKSTEARFDEPTRMRVDFPEGSVTSVNDLEVSVTRQVAGGDCRFEPQGYPAQLLPSSRLLLGSSDAPEDFSDLPSAFNGGFTVVVDSAAVIPSVATLISPLAGDQTNVSVSYGEAPTSSPYVYVSETAPAGTSPKIDFDSGVVELASSGGESLVTSAALSNLTVAQLLNDGSAPVLWIRPGTDFASLANAGSDAFTLSYGDVAIIGADKINLNFSTTRDRLIDIRYPERFSLAQFLSDYSLWLIGLGWLLLSAGFIYILRRVYAGRKAAE